MYPFSPRIQIPDVSALTAEFLQSRSITGLLLDVDCTLKRYSQTELEDFSAAWLDDMRNAGIGLCLVSNGKPHRIGLLAQKLNLPFCALALKPLPFGALRAMKEQGWNKNQTAMVGDQIYADIMAANLAGITSILVTPLHPEEEPWFTRLKRPFEFPFKKKRCDET